jgi:hypothetical protein
MLANACLYSLSFFIVSVLISLFTVLSLFPIDIGDLLVGVQFVFSSPSFVTASSFLGLPIPFLIAHISLDGSVRTEKREQEIMNKERGRRELIKQTCECLPHTTRIPNANARSCKRRQAHAPHHTTPRHATPCHATPRHATPHHITPYYQQLPQYSFHNCNNIFRMTSKQVNSAKYMKITHNTPIQDIHNKIQQLKKLIHTSKENCEKPAENISVNMNQRCLLTLLESLVF